jgi:energy-coupling factor transporter ATP-binding protein EcfA2
VAADAFRAFDTAEMHLPSEGLVLVAGPNNAGKSALLSALDFVAGIGGDIAALRHAGADRPAQVAATFALTISEQLELLAGTPIEETLMSSTTANHLQLVFEEENAGLVLAEVRGEPPFVETGRRRNSDDLGLAPFVTTGKEEGGQLYGPMVMRALQAGNESHDTSLAMFGSPRWGSPVSLQTMLTNEQIPIMQPVMRLLSQWREQYYHFRALRPGTQRSVNLTVASKLAPTGENLAAVLLDLLTNRPELLEELRKLITDIVPEIGDLRIRTKDSSMGIVFAAEGIELNIKDLGTGVEQLLLTLVVGLTEIPPFTLVVEEPETNLHPAAQRALLGLFKIWAESRQIIAATHSPVMLDWSPGGDRLLHVSRSRGVSIVTPVRDDPSVLLSSLGVRLSDVLSAERVLVIEGPSDEDILAVWFPEVLLNPNVAIIYGDGGDSARYADRFAEWLTGVDKIGLRKVLYLRDRDELSPSAIRKLEAKNTVSVLKRREIENYLLHSSAIAAVLDATLEPDGERPSVDAVDAAINEAAESLRRKMIVNRVCRQVEPDQPLMDHRLRQQLADAGADAEEITGAVLSRLMSADDLRAQIASAWQSSESFVENLKGGELVGLAPGEEILDSVFMRFAARHYRKRSDGIAIAQSMSSPPGEIQSLFEDFMTDSDDTLSQ